MLRICRTIFCHHCRDGFILGSGYQGWFLRLLGGLGRVGMDCNDNKAEGALVDAFFVVEASVYR